MEDSVKNNTKKIIEKAVNNKKIVIPLLIIATLIIIYYLHKKYENIRDINSVNSDQNTMQNTMQNTIHNEPENTGSATEFRQSEPNVSNGFYDRITGTVTNGNEFLGLADEIYPADGSTPISNYGEIDKLDDGYNGNMGLNYNMCSKSCCAEQYPVPFGLESDILVEKSKDKFVLNNYRCNNSWNNVGCVCMTKKQQEYIGSRGGNSK